MLQISKMVDDKLQQQVRDMEKKMRAMESQLAAASAQQAPPEPNNETNDMMQMLLALDKKLQESEENMEREKKLLQRERELQEMERKLEEEKLRLAAEKTPVEPPLPDLSTMFTEQQLEKLEQFMGKFDIESLEQKLEKISQFDDKNLDKPPPIEILQQSPQAPMVVPAPSEEGGELQENLAKFQEFMSMVNLDDLQTKLSKLDHMPGLPESTKSYKELKEDLAELQKILFSPESSQQDIERANIEIEKVMQDIERSPDFQAEQAKQRNAWLAEQKPKNTAAFARVCASMQSMDVKEFTDLMRKTPELQLILSTKEEILRKHQSDFRNYVLSVSEDQLRAIRHNLPKFRPDQKTQIRFAETIDNKIREIENAPKKPPKIERVTPIRKWKPKIVSGGGGSFMDELQKKFSKTEDGDSDA